MALHGHITVTRESEDGLSRKRWVFTAFHIPAIHLEEYAEEARKTKRHKWQIVDGQAYDRLRGSRNYTHKILEEPQTPQDVIDEILEIVRSKVQFQVWKERERIF